MYSENNVIDVRNYNDVNPDTELPQMTCEITGFEFVIDSGSTKSMMSITNIKPDKWYQCLKRGLQQLWMTCKFLEKLK